MPLSGKTALVTGSFAGLGYAIAEELARQGANVVLHGLEPVEAGRPAASAMRQAYKVKAEYLRADLVNPAEIEALVVDAERVGAVDILVNNAVVRYFSPIEALSLDKWNQALAVNLTAPFLLIGRCLPAMRQRGWGRIFNLSSIYGSRGAVDRVDYVTTKTALLGLTRAVALETATGGITCNAICPGATLTPDVNNRIKELMADRSLGEEEARTAFLAGRVPTQQFTDARHVGALVAFLCGQAGNGVTGAMLPLDGGWLAS